MENHPQSRAIIVVEGNQDACLSYAKAICADLDALYLDDPQKANENLGQEFDAVVFNAFNSFSVNAFGAMAGTIRGGGYLLLLKPLSWALDSLFLKRFSSLLQQAPSVTFQTPTDAPILLEKPPQKTHTSHYATPDQEKAVAAIKHVVTGHRRRPLVITSDRGRGKSAALGIAALELSEEAYKKIIVCAPSKNTAKIIFKHAKTKLSFYSPDELQQQKPEADLLLIDEAAAIPVPLLSDFLKHYSRLVFATTQHGYEGSGRGFAINFKKVLDNETPDWKSCELTTPIRWQENDPLENFVFKALMLDAKPVDAAKVEAFDFTKCEVSKLNKDALIKDDEQLAELFGLLVGAHYQTKPSDFMQMLDDASISIYALRFNHHMVAVLLLAQEGEIDQQLSPEIFKGNRRIKGHLVAQALAANMGIENAPSLKGQRITRIAVHPALQDQGLGSHLLKTVAAEAQGDYLSTSFGATQTLIHFWEKNGFASAYLSMKRDASSGTHSVIMLCSKTKDGDDLLRQARQSFIESFPLLLSDPFCHLEADVALGLLSGSRQAESLSDQEMRIVEAFADHQRGYENSLLPIWKLLNANLEKLKSLDANHKDILLFKVLQKHSWQTIADKMDDVSGKKQALALLREAVQKLLTVSKQS